ncbi:LOW QUALITY PROTEIN: hypothetical protein PHMEG_00020187 [Phytophthora megakarya]|uniref:CCHC-type domain-containing protein n=1 Tax=Phytophthora megakarya TaxID=4795 RepID=A0A225VQN7_9STRA|nr:LOW QUALITY PROTEIN: hypothetical protein PHMEG_00020187 [Phytophthora megakarya]
MEKSLSKMPAKQYYGLPVDPHDDTLVPTIASNLGPSAMNWYRAFCQHCQAHGLPRTWGLFKTEIRKRYRARDFEFDLRQRLCKLRQHGSYHDYVSEFQNLLIQCLEPISPLEQRFYFQQGLRGDTCCFINDPGTLDEAIDWGSQFENVHFASNRNDGTDRNWTKTATCHRCKEVGHIAPDCPHK